jgi:hypothetical protein
VVTAVLPAFSTQDVPPTALKRVSHSHIVPSVFCEREVHTQVLAHAPNNIAIKAIADKTDILFILFIIIIV